MRTPSVLAHSKPSGQGLVEFALVLPIFLLMVFAVIDGGRLIYMNSVLSQAAREGARQAAVEASWFGSSDLSCGKTGGPTCPATAALLKADALAAANRMVAPFGSVGALYISCDTPSAGAPAGAWTSGTACDAASGTTGNLISVRVTLSFTAITPIIGQILGTVPLAGAATMVSN